jgi:tetratricopeptide (TPR) repeat protein
MRVAPVLLAAVFAVTLSASAATEAPADVRELLLMGIRLHESGAYDDAIAVYRRVLESDPSNAEARYEIAFSTFAKGDYLAAAGMLDEIVAAPDTAPQTAWLLLGMSHAMLGHWALAEDTFRKGLALAPKDPNLRFHLALSQAAQGRFEPAIDAFEDCLRDSPYRAEVWRSFGDALYDSGAKGRAFAAYARSLTLEGDTPPSEEVARKMWEMIFEGLGDANASSSTAPGRTIRVSVPKRTTRSSPSVAEAAGLSMIAVLRYEDHWKEKNDATFFVYALDTMLRLVSSLQAREKADPFWGPFVFAYFDAMRAGGHMEALAYDIRRTAGDPDAVEWHERNLAKLDAFRRSSDRWAVDLDRTEDKTARR